jgi:hypothetical protein
VFLISSHLSLHADIFRRIIMACLTTECHIITSYSEDDHALELDHDNSLIGRYSQDGQVDLGN